MDHITVTTTQNNTDDFAEANTYTTTTNTYNKVTMKSMHKENSITFHAQSHLKPTTMLM